MKIKIKKKNIIPVKLAKSTCYFAGILLLMCVCLSYSCRKAYVPRPYGYYRVYIPEHEYKTLDTLGLPYRFDISELATVNPRNSEDEKYWIDIKYPMLNATIHCSYKPIHGNMLELSEDTWKFVSAHTSHADDIENYFFEYPEMSVYGILYDLKGNVASPVQFVVTDSVQRFFRGALYFQNVPNKDSIAPMVDYVREDIIRLMESFEWVK